MDTPALYGGFDDPKTQGILALAAGLLQASGPQRYPNPMGGIGAGLQQGLSAYQSAQQANMERQLQQQKLAQMQQQNDINKQFAPMLQNPQAYSPDTLEQVGMKLGISGHPGSATFLRIADARRAQMENEKQFGMMKSGDGYGGLFGTLADSPYVGKEATALQGQIDKAEKGNPAEWVKRYERLRDAHFKSLEASNKNDQSPVAVIDPKTNRPIFVSRSKALGMTPANVSNATAVAGDPNLHGEEYLASLKDPGLAGLVKKVANYEIDPKTFSTRGGSRERILSQVAQFDPNFDQKNYNSRYQAIQRFATGTQGNTTRSLNVAIEHMDTARSLGMALQNKDIPAFNAAAQMIAQQTGRAAPTSFDAVKDILADEVVKGVLGGAGAMEDRKKMADNIKRSSSPQQLNGVLNTWTELLSGQLKGLEKQYEGATGMKDFRDRYLTPRAKDALSGQQKPVGGWSVRLKQ